ncbi:hypothetical protein [Halobium salinum]|uniref:hypothetical protein n=1 Tax=Halobium salinum TaxID=1364940 RepID=UPI002270165E|nr:hypothetical protein [Halobium salinum]
MAQSDDETRCDEIRGWGGGTLSDPHYYDPDQDSHVYEEYKKDVRWFEDIPTALRYAVRYMEGDDSVIPQAEVSTTQTTFSSIQS